MYETTSSRIEEKQDKEKEDEKEEEEEEEEEGGVQLENDRPPSHIDLRSTSPAPELPTRSPLRSGFRARDHSESEGAINDPDSDADETQKEKQSNTASSYDVEKRGRREAKAGAQHPEDRPRAHADQADTDAHDGSGSGSGKPSSSSSSSPTRSIQPQPQPQPTLNATPTHAHVKAGAGVSIGGPVGMMRSPGVEQRMAEAGDARDAQEQEGGNKGEDGDVNEDDSYVDASADFAVPGEQNHPHPLRHSSTNNRYTSNGVGEHEEHEVTGAVTGRGGGGKDHEHDNGKGKDEKRKSGGLISKMRRTLSRATNGPGSGSGRHVS